jgi:hypothetical protein
MRNGDLPPDRSDIHDPAPAALPHVWDDIPHECERSPKMELHGAFKIFALHVLERTDFDDAGVVDQDVDRAEMADDVPDGCLDLLAVEQIAGNDRNIAASVDELVMRALKFIKITGEQGNAPAFRADLPRQHQSEAARSAGDQANLASERKWAPRDLSKSPACEDEPGGA